MRGLPVAALLIATPVLAAEPDLGCAASEGGIAEVVCGSDALAALDAELRRLYRAAVDDPQVSDEALRELRAPQRVWVQRREACRDAAAGLETCLRDQYATRIHDLRQSGRATGDEGGASQGPFTLVCDGANDPISAVFVDGPEPLAVLGWRGDALVLPQVRSASGARYESDQAPGGPARLWTKGDEAMFTLGETDFTCRFDRAVAG